MTDRTKGPAADALGGGGPPASGDGVPPSDPPEDPFTRGQRDAEALRRVREGLREDVRAMVREEVSRAGMSRSELERLVRDAASREPRGAEPAGSAWRSAAVAGVGVVVGLAAGVLGYGAFAGDGTDAGSPAVEVSSPALPDESAGRSAAAESTDPAPGSASSPGERAALYDSLLNARSERLAPLVARLTALGPAAPVSEAARVWRSGGALDAAGRRRLHDALVQLALNDEAGAGLALDGLLTRDPCRGDSCGALLELWRTRGAELGMPDLPAEPASDTPALAVAERVLVLGRLDAPGTTAGGSASSGSGPGEAGEG